MQEGKTWGVIRNVPDHSLLSLCHLIAFIAEITSKSWQWVRSLNHVSQIGQSTVKFYVSTLV